MSSNDFNMLFSTSPSLAPSAFSPLSPLSSPDMPPLHQANLRAFSPRTRQRSGSGSRPSLRLRDSSNAAVHAVPARRLRPLACVSPNGNNVPTSTHASAAANGEGLSETKGVCKGETRGAFGSQTIEFPPPHVVLHPDDASNKVFLAMGRAFLSVGNRAMTVKDLAELSMQHGLVCQNVSAAAQAITFFIRTHLARCEAEQDFPLVLRLVMYGTAKDDSIAAGLHSRSAGNTGNKSAKDENGKLGADRATCFRRGSTVWYLSKAAGAPCPFARAGIALRDYCEVSGITGAESRKGNAHSDYRGMKRKRERGSWHRGTSSTCEDDDESAEGKKPPKVKLTLRLRPCLTTMRDTQDTDSSAASDSDSGSDLDDTLTARDACASASAPQQASACARGPTWTFPPFPIQRRISIPPYTPSEETYPAVSSSPGAWPMAPKPKLGLSCVDTPPRMSSRRLAGPLHGRSPSLPFSVASPPPDSDEDFDLNSDDDEDRSLSQSPICPIKHEDYQFAYTWPRVAASNPSLNLPSIKAEPALDEVVLGGSSPGSLTTTIKQVKIEELDVGLESLSLSFECNYLGDLQCLVREPLDGRETGMQFSSTVEWGRHAIVDLTQEDPVLSTGVASDSAPATYDLNGALKLQWKDADLAGPDSVQLRDLDEERWGDSCTWKSNMASPIAEAVLQKPFEQDSRSTEPRQVGEVASVLSALPRSPSPDAFIPMSPALTYDSLSSPLPDSVRSWSVDSPNSEMDSVGPASPPLFGSTDSVVDGELEETLHTIEDDESIAYTEPLMAPCKQPLPVTAVVRHTAQSDVNEIALSESSAPWERGMISPEDVEEHLLSDLPLTTLLARALPQLTRVPSIENPAPELPLSPQEEAVFQSLCMCPDQGWEESRDDVQDVRQFSTDFFKATEVSSARDSSPQPTLPADGPRGEVFVAATRPSIASRGKCNRKRRSIGNQLCPEDESVDENGSEYDGLRSPSQPKEKMAGATPLRRSKRVACAVAVQRNRERLRKRTLS